MLYTFYIALHCYKDSKFMDPQNVLSPGLGSGCIKYVMVVVVLLGWLYYGGGCVVVVVMC